MKRKLIILIIVIGIIFVISGYLKFQYNRLVQLNQKVKEAWAQVENVYQRRTDLIPNLVATVKGYAQHEKELFLKVTEARTKWQNAKTMREKEIAAGELESAISKLLLVVENYPQLKASENFLALQDELAGTENRIAVERRRYNQTVKEYNRIVKTFPTFLFARLFGFSLEKPYFKAVKGAERPPEVKF